MDTKIIIKQDAMGRYRISIGVGKIYSTKDCEEVKAAIGHYFHDGVNPCRLGNNPKCPLCRGINDEMAAMRRKSAMV